MYVKDRLRRSMMFVPGNNPGMIRDAHIYGADSIMFDLEDSVAYTEKDSARFLVYNALKTLHFGTKETVVRINDLSSGLGVQDLEAVVRAGVQVVRLPKTDSAQDVIDCEREIQRIERQAGIPVGTTGMMAAIESANGVLHAAEIAHASDRLIGIALGAEDYVTDLKTTRSDGIELLFARCMILNAARSAGIAALDTVYSDVNNEEGFIAEATLIKKLGFDGKSVINPRQIEPLHHVFMPSEKDLNKARAIMDAIEQLLLMLLLGIVLVYLVMVAQFQSLRSPLIVMFTIPLAFTGGFLALLLAGIEVSVVSLVGFVMLVGVIVNNGIVLVDYINQLRLGGMGRREAIIEAGVTRLRPILMTSLTTILGLVVMAFGKDVGTALMQPVALVCIGGLLYATLMTLLVVPCMYDILSRRDLRKVNEEELQLLDL